MISPNQEVPAFRSSATARELERIRAKRRLLETVAKVAPTSAGTAVTQLQQQTASATKGDVDPVNRNAKIKANARKLLDQLQAADTSLGDTAHNLKLLFAKQALRALADRQAAVVAEAQQRKLDKLQERLVEEHQRQLQQKREHSVQMQMQVQQQALSQAQLPARPPSVPTPSPGPTNQLSPTRLERGRSPQSWHRSRSRRNRRRSPSRRSPSPPKLEKRSGEDYDSFLSGYSCDSDVQRSDAVHVRDTRGSSSRGRDRNAHGSRSRNSHYREPRLAGPTEAGVRGAVSAQALSALLAGLQSHGVNLTSGPPPLPPVTAGQSNPMDNGEMARGSASGAPHGGGGAAKGGDSAAAEQQYVLLPDGTVGLVHTIVKPAVLQPKVPGGGQMPPAPPHAVPLVLLQPGGPGTVGSGTATATIAPWHTPYPYSTMGPPPPPPPAAPYYPSSPLGLYGTQAQYSYPPSLYSLHNPISPSPYSIQTPASTGPAAMAPSLSPQQLYMSLYSGADGAYYRHQTQQQQQRNQDPQIPSANLAGTAAHIQEPQGHHPYAPYRTESSLVGHQRSGVGQLTTAASQLGRDVDPLGGNVRHSVSSLSSDPYGNLAGSVLIGAPTEDGAGGGGGSRIGGVGVSGGSRASPQPQPPPQAMTPSSPNQQTSSSGLPSSGTDTPQGNVPGGSGVYSGGRYHHRHSHSGAESLRSLPSNSGGSTRGGPGSMSISQQYEATLASPSLRGSLQDLDSPASFRDMPRRASGSISLSPLRGGARGGGGGGVHGSLDSGPHFASGAGDGAGDHGGGGSSGATRRRPSPLLVASVANDRGSDANMPPAMPLGSSGSSSGGSVVLRVTAAGSVPAQLPQGVGEPSGLGSGAGTGGGDEPSLLLRTLDLGSSSMQRSKVSDDQAETPTSRKPSLTSPWSSSGPSDAVISASGGVNLGGYGGHSSGIGGAPNAATFPSTRDLLSDVVSRPPLYGTSLPYGTAGLYDRYAAGGFYGATGGMYSPSPLYGAPPTGGNSFGGFDVSAGSGSLLDRGASGGSGGGGSGLGTGVIIGGGGSPSAAPRSPSTDSLRSAGTGVRAYTSAASPAAAAHSGQTALSTATSDLMGTSAALALTAAILEGSPASAAANSIIAGSTGLGQLGLNHLHPTAAVISSMPSATGTIPTAANSGNAPPLLAGGGLDRSLSMNRATQVSENGSGAGGAGPRGGVGSGPQGISVASAASAAFAARLSQGSNLDNMYSPRTRSRVQLMGNDDFSDAFSPRSPNISGSNPQLALINGQTSQSQLASTGSMRLTAATLNAQQQQLQQQLQQQGPTSPAQPAPSRLGSVRSPASGASGGSGSAAAVNISAGATDIGGLQSMVPTLQLPPRATSRMLGGPVSVAAAVAAAPQMPHGGGAGSGTSAPSSENASPTRIEHPGLSDLRDIDAEQSLSARSGRSALSEGAAGGGIVTGASISSVERVSGVPVVEHHRDGGSDPAAYSGLMGAQPFDAMADVGIGISGSGFGGAYSSSTGYVTGVAAPMAGQQPQPGLPPLLELLSNSPFAATASPSGSAGLSPLGFGGGSTPLERSADSFVRFGSMPFSGAASPMATHSPIELLGSPTKHPQGQLSAVVTRGSSGGASSAGGAASTGGGGSSRSAVSATISAALPQLQLAVPGPSQHTATATANPQLQATPAGQIVPGPQQQPQQTQHHLGGMAFRMSNTGNTGAVSSQTLGTVTSTVATVYPAAAPAAATGPVGPISPSGSAVGRTTSIQNMPAAANPLPASGASGKVLSAAASKTARSSAASPAAVLPASPSQRGAAASSAGGRTGTTAILSRVLAGRGEFDSDDDDDSGGVADGGSSFSMSLRRGPSSGLQRPSGLAPAMGSPTGPRATGAAVLSPGRGTLTGGSNAHDDEFNF